MSVEVEVSSCSTCPLRNGSDQGSACRHPDAQWRRIKDEELDTYDEQDNFVELPPPSWCPLREKPIALRVKAP